MTATLSSGPEQRWQEVLRRAAIALEGRELAGVCLGLIDDPERRVKEVEREDCFEHAPVGLQWTAADGTILDANQSELDTLGYQREEYVGRNIAQFFVDPQPAADALRRLRTGETLHNVETRMRRRDGSIRHGLTKDRKSVV